MLGRLPFLPLLFLLPPAPGPMLIKTLIFVHLIVLLYPNIEYGGRGIFSERENSLFSGLKWTTIKLYKTFPTTFVCDCSPWFINSPKSVVCRSAVRVLYWPVRLGSIEFDKVRLPSSLGGYVRIWEAMSLKAFHSISDSKTLLPYIYIINTTIHPYN